MNEKNNNKQVKTQKGFNWKKLFTILATILSLLSFVFVFRIFAPIASNKGVEKNLSEEKAAQKVLTSDSRKKTGDAKKDEPTTASKDAMKSFVIDQEVFEAKRAEYGKVMDNAFAQRVLKLRPKPTPLSQETIDTFSTARIYAPFIDAGMVYNRKLYQVVMDKILPSSQLIHIGFLSAPNYGYANEGGSPDKDQLKVLELSNYDAHTGVAVHEGQPFDIPVAFAGAISPDNTRYVVLSWAGNSILYSDMLDEIRKAGKDYVFSFGGWRHNTPAIAVAKASEVDPNKFDEYYLAAMYSWIIDALDIHFLDFDIEGTDALDNASNASSGGMVSDDGKKGASYVQGHHSKEARILRLKALSILTHNEKYRRTFHVSFTLPTFINGLSDINNDMILAALNDGVIDRVNLMTMDYFVDKQLVLPGLMAVEGINAINAVVNMIISSPESKIRNRAVAMRKMGITPMLGKNDAANEMFSITDAKIVTNWAIQNNIGFVGGWAGQRDFQEAMSIATGQGYYTGVYPVTELAKGMTLIQPKIREVTTGLPIVDGSYSSIFARAFAVNPIPIDEIHVPKELLNSLKTIAGINGLSGIFNYTSANLDKETKVLNIESDIRRQIAPKSYVDYVDSIYRLEYSLNKESYKQPKLPEAENTNYVFPPFLTKEMLNTPLDQREKYTISEMDKTFPSTIDTGRTWKVGTVIWFKGHWYQVIKSNTAIHSTWIPAGSTAGNFEKVPDSYDALIMAASSSGPAPRWAREGKSGDIFEHNGKLWMLLRDWQSQWTYDPTSDKSDGDNYRWYYDIFDVDNNGQKEGYADGMFAPLPWTVDEYAAAKNFLKDFSLSESDVRPEFLAKYHTSSELLTVDKILKTNPFTSYLKAGSINLKIQKLGVSIVYDDPASRKGNIIFDIVLRAYKKQIILPVTFGESFNEYCDKQRTELSSFTSSSFTLKYPISTIDDLGNVDETWFDKPKQNLPSNYSLLYGWEREEQDVKVTISILNEAQVAINKFEYPIALIDKGFVIDKTKGHFDIDGDPVLQSPVLKFDRSLVSGLSSSTEIRIVNQEYIAPSISSRIARIDADVAINGRVTKFVYRFKFNNPASTITNGPVSTVDEYENVHSNLGTVLTNSLDSEHFFRNEAEFSFDSAGHISSTNNLPSGYHFVYSTTKTGAFSTTAPTVNAGSQLFIKIAKDATNTKNTLLHANYAFSITNDAKTHIASQPILAKEISSFTWSNPGSASALVAPTASSLPQGVTFVYSTTDTQDINSYSTTLPTNVAPGAKVYIKLSTSSSSILISDQATTRAVIANIVSLKKQIVNPSGFIAFTPRVTGSTFSRFNAPSGSSVVLKDSHGQVVSSSTWDSLPVGRYTLELVLNSNGEWANGVSQPSPKHFEIEPPLTQPTVTIKKSHEPSSGQSNGWVIFRISGFSPSKMTISLADGSSGTLGSYSAGSIIVNGLAAGQKAQIKIEPKDSLVWNDKSRTPKLSPEFTISSGTPATSTPTTSTSTSTKTKVPAPSALNMKNIIQADHGQNNGKLILTLVGFDSTKMTAEIAPGQPGSLNIVGQEATISGLANGQSTAILVNLKDKTGTTWANGGIATLRFGTPSMNEKDRGQLVIPQMNIFDITKSHSSQSDGSVTFEVIGFDSATMDISKVHGTAGTLGTFSNGKVTISGLSNNDKVQIQVTIKDSNLNIWRDTTISAKNSIEVTMHDTTGTPTATITTPSTSTLPKIATPSFEISSITQPTSGQSDGSISFLLRSFDPTTMDISKAPGSAGTLSAVNHDRVTISGLSNNDFAKIQITLKDASANTWSDSTTNPIFSAIFVAHENHPTLVVPTTGISTITQPTHGQSDGSVTFSLTNFDPTTMQIAKASGSAGTLGTYSPSTSTITITGLADNQVAQIQIELKNTNSHVWADGSTTAKISSSILTHQGASTVALHPVGYPVIELISITKPANGNSDGRVLFRVVGYDPNTMIIEKALHSDGQISQFDSKTKTISITNLASGNYAQLQIRIKDTNANSWENGLTKPILSSLIQIHKSLPTLAIPTFSISSITNPSPSHSDGSVTFTINNYDSTKMSISKVAGTPGTLGTVVNNHKITVEGLSSNQVAQIQITLKDSSVNTWADSTITPKVSSSFTIHELAPSSSIGPVINAGSKSIVAPTISIKTTHSPTNISPNGGQIVYHIDGFDPATMVISRTSHSSGVLGNFDSVSGDITLSYLHDGETGQIEVRLKDTTNLAWADTTTDPKQSTSTAVTPVILVEKPTFEFLWTKASGPYDSAHPEYGDGKLIMKVVSGSFNDGIIIERPHWMGGNEWDNFNQWHYDFDKKEIVFDRLYQKDVVQITMSLKPGYEWSDGSKGLWYAVNKWSQGKTSLTTPTITQTVHNPSTTTSTDGSVTFTLQNYDPRKMVISNANNNGVLGIYDEDTHTIKITNLIAGEEAKIKIDILDKTENVWSDFTSNSIESSAATLTQTVTGVAKPIISSFSIKEPSSTTSADGEITFNLENFNPAAMTVQLVDTAHGTLGAYDAVSHTIKVTGLSSSQNAQLEFYLSYSNIWTTGETHSYKTFVASFPTHNVGVTKPTITYQITKPTTKSTFDGVATFTIPNFNPTTMRIVQVPNSDGILGSYDYRTHTISVNGLTDGDRAQIQINLVGANLWRDSSSSNPLQSPVALIEQSNNNISEPYFVGYAITKPIAQPAKNGGTQTIVKGSIAFKIENFDPNSMQISLVDGSSGTLGTYNPTTKEIIVSELMNGEFASLKITLIDPHTHATIRTINEIISPKIIANAAISHGLIKPQISTGIATPETADGHNWHHDGIVTFDISGFDPNRMIIVQVPGSSGHLEEYVEDGGSTQRHGTIKVTGLSSIEHAQIKIKPKTGNFWVDNSNGWIISKELAPINSIEKPTIKGVQIVEAYEELVSKTFELKMLFNVENFDPALMDIDVFTNNNGYGEDKYIELQKHSIDFKDFREKDKEYFKRPGVADHLEEFPSYRYIAETKQIEVTMHNAPVSHLFSEEGLNYNTHKPTYADFPIFIGISPKSTPSQWVDPSWADGEKKFVLSPKFSFVKPSDEETQNLLDSHPGVRSFQYFLVATQNDKLIHSDSVFAPDFTPVVKAASTPTSNDGEITFTIDDAVSDDQLAKTTFRLSPKSNTQSGVLEAFDPATRTIKVTGLKFGESIILEMIGNTAEKLVKIASPIINVPVYHHQGLPEATPDLIVTPTFTTENVKQPQTTSSVDGEIKIKVQNYDKTKMKVLLSSNSSGEIKSITDEGVVTISKLISDQFAQIEVLPTSTYEWGNGLATSPIISPRIYVQSRYAGEEKPVISAQIKKATTSTSNDGEIRFNLANFDPKTMTIGLATGSAGTLGTYDAKTNSIKVTGLNGGDNEALSKAQIYVAFKPSAISARHLSWTDGSITSITSSEWQISQTYIGLTKPTIIISTFSNPTTSNSNDGEVTFKLAHFDETKFFITQATGSNGMLSTYDPTSKTIKVTGLGNGQVAQISILPRSTESWTDGTRTPFNSVSKTVSTTKNGIVKPIFTSYVVKKASTTTSKDGEVTFTVIGFDSGRMEMSLANPIEGGSIQPFNSRTHTVTITGLSSNQKVALKVSLKHPGTPGVIWEDGSTFTSADSSEITLPTTTYVGLPVVTIDSVSKKDPSTINAVNGEVTFHLNNFDPSRMIISQGVGTDGNMEEYDSITHTIKITGLSTGEIAQISIIPNINKNEKWADGTVAPVISVQQPVSQTITGLSKPSLIQTSIIKPTISSSNNGKAIFKLNGFDPLTMEISKTSASSGNLGTYDRIAHTIEITDLSSGQTAQISISPKAGHVWNNGQNNAIIFARADIVQNFAGYAKPSFIGVDNKQPSTSTTNDGEITFKIAGFDPTKMDITQVSGTGGILQAFDPVKSEIKVTNLLSGQEAQIQITPKIGKAWTDGSVTAIISTSYTSSQNFTGLTKPKLLSTIENKPTSSSTLDGSIVFSILGFDSTKMTISKMTSTKGTLSSFADSTHTITVNGLTNGDHVQIKIELNHGEMWSDGSTNAIEFQEMIVSQTNPGLSKPTITTQKIIQPKTTLSQDGEVTFSLDGFDPATMTISQVAQTSGVLHAYDPSTKTIKVTNLANGWSTQIQVMPKSGFAWMGDSSTNVFIQSPKETLAQANNGLAKPTLLSDTVIQPTVIASHDGEVQYRIQGFDSTKMNISIVSGKKGTLGSYNSITHSIKVTGLGNGDSTQIEITPKDTQMWNDGSTTPIKSVIETTTQTIVGLVKPRIISANSKSPSTVHTHDGEVTIKLSGFNPVTMDIMQALGTNGVMETYDSVTQTIKITHLSNGETAQLQILPKPGNTWTDGTATSFDTQAKQITQTYAGLAKPIIVSSLVEKPSTGITNDGAVTFTISGFDESVMAISTTATGSSGTLASYDSITHTIKVTGLSHGDKLQIQINPTLGNKWQDGSKDSIKSSEITIAQSYSGISKPAFTSHLNNPSTSNINDGSVEFTLSGFDPASMIITKIENSNGLLGVYNPVTHKIIVSKLSNGQAAQIQVTPKKGQAWIDGTRNPVVMSSAALVQNYPGLVRAQVLSNFLTKPSTSHTNDGTIIFQLSNFDPSKMSLSTNVGSLGTYDPREKEVTLSGLTNGDNAQIQITLNNGEKWQDGKTDVVSSASLMVSQTYNGLAKPTINISGTTQPTTTTTNDGAVTFSVIGFDSNTMLLSQTSNTQGDLTIINEDTSDSVTVWNLRNGQTAQIQITLKSGEAWADGSKIAILSQKEIVEQTNEGVSKPVISSHHSVDPTTTSATNGEVTFKLLWFDPTKMDISQAENTSGVLSAYDAKTNSIKITGLANGEKAQIQITPKSGFVWSDGLRTTVTSQLITMNQDYIGLSSPSFVTQITKPTDSASNDGTITFTLSGFDPKTEAIALVSETNGLLGEYNADTKKIEITELSNGDVVQLQIIPMIGQYWIDGTRTAKLSNKLDVIQLTPPTVKLTDSGSDAITAGANNDPVIRSIVKELDKYFDSHDFALHAKDGQSSLAAKDKSVLTPQIAASLNINSPELDKILSDPSAVIRYSIPMITHDGEYEVKIIIEKAGVASVPKTYKAHAYGFDHGGDIPSGISAISIGIIVSTAVIGQTLLILTALFFIRRMKSKRKLLMNKNIQEITKEINIGDFDNIGNDNYYNDDYSDYKRRK